MVDSTAMNFELEREFFKLSTELKLFATILCSVRENKLSFPDYLVIDNSVFF